MTDLIETYYGWVPAERVATVERDPERGVVLRDANGKHLGETLGGRDFMPRVTIPAAPGTTLLYLERPEKPDAPIEVGRVPVLAWRVPLGAGTPWAVDLDGHDDILNEIRDDGGCGAFKVVQLPSGELFAVVPAGPFGGCVTQRLPTLADAERLAREMWAEADAEAKVARAERMAYEAKVARAQRTWAKQVTASSTSLDEDMPPF